MDEEESCSRQRKSPTRDFFRKKLRNRMTAIMGQQRKARPWTSLLPAPHILVFLRVHLSFLLFLSMPFLDHFTHGRNLHPSSDDLLPGIRLPSTHLHLCVHQTFKQQYSVSGREPTTPRRSEWHHHPPMHLVTNQARRPEAIPGLPLPHSHIQSFRVL